MNHKSGRLTLAAETSAKCTNADGRIRQARTPASRRADGWNQEGRAFPRRFSEGGVLPIN